MHVKNIHCMIEKLAECAKCEVENGIEQLDTKEMGEVTDMIKDLCEAEYYARIAKAMEKSEEDEKKEDEYFLKMLKEEYGEEEGEKRFYSGQPRSSTSGRFMRRGDGRRSNRGGRRGYEEPMYEMTPEMFRMYPAEHYRDMDRAEGRMYYSSGASTGSESSSGNMGASSGGRGYSEGFEDGTRRGYQEGYSEGSRSGRRDGREGRSGQSRRSYMETKETKKENTPEDKQAKMKELERYTKELAEDVTEMISDASSEEKNLLKQKMQMLIQKI